MKTNIKLTAFTLLFFTTIVDANNTPLKPKAFLDSYIKSDKNIFLDIKNQDLSILESVDLIKPASFSPSCNLNFEKILSKLKK